MRISIARSAIFASAILAVTGCQNGGYNSIAKTWWPWGQSKEKYDTSALAACCQGVIDLASAQSLARPIDTAGDTRRGHDTIREFRRAHAR